MSKALKCDRCGKLYEPYEPISNQFYVTQKAFNGTTWDLCTDCSWELYCWMEDKRNPKCAINGLTCDYCKKRHDCHEDMAVEYRKGQGGENEADN